ncbi:gamma-aminobutyrate:alpha-ketoglutarate aminotransferase [Vibrio maritimus]|uniref:Gamma-aminobutyrate:alpha-ketoglutarate aminotransferase n=1 Tax=Vibrio maritimus TaxID=990268 RepID=A0A090TLX5_9VIBR|nr:gamma-aminobutyrate:alpha-ketoglutarate aminotransferase [Vibrio maritimus]
MTTQHHHKSSNGMASNQLLSAVVKLGFPVAIQSALVAILALADVLMVSDIGKEATAAVGIASKWHFVAIMIMAGMASANGVLVLNIGAVVIKPAPIPSLDSLWSLVPNCLSQLHW